MTPLLLIVMVVLWLRAIQQVLPNIVKQRFATELRNKTLFSMREEITGSLRALLLELSSVDNHLTAFTGYASGGGSHMTNFATRQRQSCCLCKANNRREWKDNFFYLCAFSYRKKIKNI